MSSISLVPLWPLSDHRSIGASRSGIAICLDGAHFSDEVVERAAFEGREQVTEDGLGQQERPCLPVLGVAHQHPIVACRAASTQPPPPPVSDADAWKNSPVRSASISSRSVRKLLIGSEWPPSGRSSTALRAHRRELIGHPARWGARGRCSGEMVELAGFDCGDQLGEGCLRH